VKILLCNFPRSSVTFPSIAPNNFKYRSQTSSVCMLSSEWETMFHTRMEQDWNCVIRTGIHTCVLCKFWIISKKLRQLYSLHRFSFRLYKTCGLNVFLMQCKSIPVRHKAHYLCDSILDSYEWGHRIEPRSTQNIFILSCSRHVDILHYTKNYFSKVLYFPKAITIHHCMALLQVALVSIPPHKFVRPPCLYYWL
jgi:hypothetical protein